MSVRPGSSGSADSESELFYGGRQDRHNLNGQLVNGLGICNVSVICEIPASKAGDAPAHNPGIRKCESFLGIAFHPASQPTLVTCYLLDWDEEAFP